MREILEDLGDIAPIDGTEAAQRAVRPVLRKRFFEHASVGETPDGHQVLLDGRPVRTPARAPLVAPTAALGAALAAEWDRQADAINPARMPLTRLANSIIDGVAAATEAVTEEVARYLGSDLLFYRAEGPQGLLKQQTQHWDPVLDWARDELGARFILSEGVVFVEQPARAVAAARAAIPRDPWRLGAVHSITTLTGSALLALAVARGRLSPEAAWTAAHVDENWNMEQWGQDDLAVQRRAFRWTEMEAAAAVLAKTTRG